MIPFSANVELTEPIFDILFVVRDLVEPSEDQRLARFIVGSHGQSHPSSQALPEQSNSTQESAMDTQQTAASRVQRNGTEIPQELLRKNILYAQERCSPKLYYMDEDKVARLFADMRRESLATGAYPITVLHLKAIIRISEAFCRMRLSEYCSAKDIGRAIAVTVESSVGSQKVSCTKALARASAKYTLARPGAQKGANGSGQRRPEAVMA
ncbi:dna replication licensing factor mcm2 [Trichoderma arundinaceum]|uniref:Dna replication licensing factor mcm2 n=1 Tax=Trichoderma arundinaceum TaxID=490622 RepID=A0A395NEK8_TRIAR|nr:dna replication licensing factor mcm2 [Trichoderma arundinaceum]